MSRSNVLRCSVAVVGFMVAAVAFADQPANTPVAPVKLTTAATADLICKNRLRPGSHIKMRACLTAAQWATPDPWTQGFTHEGGGQGGWGAMSTTGASIGMNGFTGR